MSGNERLPERRGVLFVVFAFANLGLREWGRRWLRTGRTLSGLFRKLQLFVAIVRAVR